MSQPKGWQWKIVRSGGGFCLQICCVGPVGDKNYPATNLNSVPFTPSRRHPRPPKTMLRCLREMQIQSGPFGKTFQHCCFGGRRRRKKNVRTNHHNIWSRRGKAGARNCKIRLDEQFHDCFHGRGPETHIKNTEFKFVAGL